MAVKKITTPLTDEVVESLRVGDEVEITGSSTRRATPPTSASWRSWKRTSRCRSSWPAP